MADFKLPSATHIGRVALRVSYLDDSVRFYEQIIGLQVLEKTAQMAVLGAGNQPLLVLDAQSNWLPKQRGVGLYHIAFLLPSRRDLAHSLRHLVKTATRLQGAADHFVSEAIYLADPEGNGLEIYADRPRSKWETLPNGQISIGTVTLDVNKLWAVADSDTFDGLPTGTTIGHIHLHASPQAETVDFYRRVIGMDEVRTYGHFHFLSAGGYHHHIALQPALAMPKPNQAGLSWYELVLPDADSRYEVGTAVARSGSTIDEVGGVYQFQDPARHTVRLVVAS